jgi:lipoate-protein ligase A
MALQLLSGPGLAPTVPPCLEEWLVERGPGAEPALFVYSWGAPALVLGYGQGDDEVDLAACRTDGVTVLRRRTGGTGVFVDGDLGVALALPREHPWARTLGGLYDRFLDVVSEGLAAVGQPVSRAPGDDGPVARTPICFEGQLRESLLVDGRKAVGCAQMRRAGGVLVHATLLLGLDSARQARAFGVPAARIEGALAPLVAAARDRAALVAALGQAFSRALELPLEPAPLPALPTSLTDRYLEPRWCPVPGPRPRRPAPVAAA